MTKPIKLTEDDFDYIHWKKDDAGPEQFELIIYGKSELHCNEIKQQILENQKFVSQYKQELKKLQKTSNKSLSIEECDKITKQMWDNEQAKQKLEKIKIIFDDGSVDDDTFFPKLEEILGDKK